MKVEQYRQQYVPAAARKEAQYYVSPADFSSGLAVNPEQSAMKGMAAAGERIAGAIKQIAEVNRKVQREKDELFLDGVFHQAGAEFSTFEPTTDTEADGKRLELIKRKYAECIENEKSISDESRTRAVQLLENRYGEAGIRIGAARARMVTNRNNRQKMQFLQECVANGDIEKALEWRGKLETAGIPVASEERIRSTCTLNGLIHEFPAAENITMIQDLEKVKACLAGKEGFLGMSRQDTRTYFYKLAEAQRVKQLESDQTWLAGFSNGDIQTEEALNAEYGSGLLDAKTYNWRLKTLQGYHHEQERALRLSEAQADKIRAKNLAGKKAEFLLAVKSFTRMKAADADSIWEDAKKQFAGHPGELNEILGALKAAQKEKNAFNTPGGTLVKKELDSLLKQKKLIYKKGWFGNGEDSPGFQADRYLELYNYAEEQLAAGETPGKIMTDIKEKVSKLNAGEVARFMIRKYTLNDTVRSAISRRSGAQIRIDADWQKRQIKPETEKQAQPSTVSNKAEQSIKNMAEEKNVPEQKSTTPPGPWRGFRKTERNAQQ